MNQQPSTSSCPARGRLERMALDVLAALCRDSDCCVEFRDRTAVQYCSETLAYVPKPEAPPRRRRLDARLAVLRPFARLLAVAGTAHALITQRRTMSLREVYYAHAMLFNAQQDCDDAVLDVAAIAEAPRSALGLVSAAKGLFHGTADLIAPGCDVVRATPTSEARAIDPSLVHRDGARVRTSAALVVVVEKEGVFARLVEDGFAAQHNALIVTGKGFPDLATRAFLRLVHDGQPSLPIHGVCDCNPYGVQILLTYHCGSARMGLDAARYRVPLACVGLHADDPIVDQLPRSARQAMTERDRARTAALLRHPLLAQRPLWRARVEAMARAGFKLELEALHALGLNFLAARWLPARVRETQSAAAAV